MKRQTTISQELMELQTSLKASITELDKAPATREGLAAAFMRADAKSKVARQIINAAQALIRISRIKADATEVAARAS